MLYVHPPGPGYLGSPCLLGGRRSWESLYGVGAMAPVEVTVRGVIFWVWGPLCGGRYLPW